MRTYKQVNYYKMHKHGYNGYCEYCGSYNCKNADSKKEWNKLNNNLYLSKNIYNDDVKYNYYIKQLYDHNLLSYIIK